MLSFKTVSLPPALTVAAIVKFTMIAPPAPDANVNAPAPLWVLKSNKSLLLTAASPTPSVKAHHATQRLAQPLTVALLALPAARSQLSTGWVNALAIKYKLIKFDGFFDSLF